MLHSHHKYDTFIYFISLFLSLSQTHQPQSAAMGACISIPITNTRTIINNSTNTSSSSSLPVDTPFTLPSPLPNWPKGGGTAFATGVIDLGGGLEVAQVTTFKKIWRSYEGGADNLGATLFEPSPIPDGFCLLGCYAQPNNKPLFGWVLVGKDSSSFNSSSTTSRAAAALANPIDYTLVWSSSDQPPNIKQDSPVYIWLPVPPDGYRAVGHAVTVSPSKPPLNQIRCVRVDLTEQSVTDELIWGINNGINLYSSKPTTISVQATGVSLGTFTATSSTTTLSCLKNSNHPSCAMPDTNQIKSIIETYSLFIYFHSDEKYLPSTVNWFFTNGGLLYQKGNESNPLNIHPNGTNLPQGGTNDGAYWLDLPTSNKDRVKRGDLTTAGCYFHLKPMLGGTFTDLVTWVYYPFNGPARAKVGLIKSLPLGKIGEHVGDWEHMTLRVSNFNGELRKVYFSEHSKGVWVDAADGVEFENGNRVVGYSSLNGHAMYPKPGLVLQGSSSSTSNGIVGIRNDTEKSGIVMDCGQRYEVVAADYEVGGCGGGGGVVVESPAWVNYMREWGPKIDYALDKEIAKISKFLPGKLKKEFEKIVRSLPAEVLGEEGPVGPKGKGNWYGDEVV